MITSIYNKVKERLQTITEIKNVGIFNMQHLNLGNEIINPSVYIEFSNVEYDTMQDIYQMANSIMVLHIYQENYQIDKEKIFELFQKITAKIHKWNPNVCSTNFVRTNVDFDYNTDSLHHTMITFAFAYVDQAVYYDENEIIDAEINEIIIDIKNNSNNTLYQTLTIN